MNNGCWVCPKLRIPPCCGSFEGNLMIHSQVYVFGVTHSDKTPKNSEKTSKSAMFFCPKTNPEFSLQDISFTMEIARFHHGNHQVSPWKSPMKKWCDLRKLRSQKLLCDVVLATEETQYLAHQAREKKSLGGKNLGMGI